MAGDEINQNMVYFKCVKCEYVFQADPMLLMRCPMCGTEDVVRA
jgi:Zn finger protein HypA/HybF involved in hydrogenase expression